VLKKLYF